MAKNVTNRSLFNQVGGDKAKYIAAGGDESVFKTLSDAAEGKGEKTSGAITSLSENTKEGASLSAGLGQTVETIFNGLNKVVKAAVGGAQAVANTQMGGPEAAGGESINKLFEIFQKGGANPLAVGWEAIKTAGSEILSQLKAESELRYKINSSTMLTGQLSEDLRGDIEQSSISAARYGMSMSDVADLYVGLVENSGKFSLINKETMNTAIPVVAALGMNMSQMATTISEYEKVGVGIDQTIQGLSDATTNSVSLGMNAKKVTQDMQANIGKLNEYGFRNGIKGLEDMARKASELRMNMDSVFQIAEKVFSPEGAIDMVANLQVLGGAIGDLNDPLKLMYMATNNVEGLQDALAGAAGSLATYNQEQGRFEVTGANLRKAKEMAQQMGISMGELNKISIAAAERTQAASAIMSSGLTMKAEDREFITNLSRMEGGEMKIMVPESIAQKLGVPTKIALDSLDEKTKEALLSNREAFKQMSPAEMAQNQLTETQQISRNMGVIAAYVKVRAAQTIRGAVEGANIDKLIGDLNKSVKGTANMMGVEPSMARADRAAAKKNTSEFITDPIQGVKKMGEFVWDKITGNETKTGTESTVKHTHTYVWGSSTGLMDQWSRETVRDSSLKQYNETNTREYTSPSIAKK
jgi:hypothetical protein